MSCCDGNCGACYEQADGSIVKRTEVNGAYEYTLEDLSVSSTVPANFISTAKVDCAKFESATTPPTTIAVLEEVDADGKQTGVLVQVTEAADGTKTYTNLSDNSAYVAPAGSTLHTSEDTDYNERTIVMCDEGVDVISTIIYKDGDITDVVSTTITTLAGTAHTLSGNETAGSCSDAIKEDQETACFVEVDTSGVPVPDKVKVTGYIKYVTDTSSSPSTTVTSFFDDADVALAKAGTGAAGYKKTSCC